MTALLDKRCARSERTGRVLTLLRAHEPARTDDEDAWAVQHATAVDQMARM
ncbi:hypothetical protein [Streptomyces sp. NWU339]|uniref:hypothetical protein n=1 Tax=Streptomyces sp. NWU339 TaxID=2185284 RepID=UPI0015E80F83|nr:hypothetical protein [Streptomyces sp. NWU339]